ncbi:MAG TPA: alpha/beta hydrolase [Vicinamibacterales bacterium]
MLRRMIAAGAALSMPGIALTVASERMIRPRVFYSGDWNPDPPDSVGWPYEEAEIYTPDGLALQGWFFKAAQPGAPTILFMHGTSYNASDMWLTPERSVAFNDFLTGIRANFFVFDYRGYGRNAGTPTEEGTYTDAASALGWLFLRSDVDPSSVFFYGFSLGTGIATELAMREPSAGLILRAPFTSIRALAIDRYEWLRLAFRFAPWLPLTNYDTLSKINRLDRPLLVMHGESDKTVPEYMGQQVFEAAPEPKMYVQFPNSGHSDISADLVVPPITQFIDEVLGRNVRSPMRYAEQA